jgi:4a-hydroxytetrahydrobiopterin dehydratase
MSEIAKKLSDQEIETHLSQLAGWEYLSDKTEITKTFSFKGYYKTIAFVNFVAWLAQKDNHHPDLWVTYGKVKVNLTTHDSGGLTEKDINLAKLMEEYFF